ncbi:MAG: ribonuclease HII [Candidatus Paceibacterota bacterium]
MKLPHKTLERNLLKNGYHSIASVDEVGMACLAGPVVVCAVLFSKDFFKKKHKRLHWIRDSKLLLPHQREEFATELMKEVGLKFQTAYCFPRTIDKINIYQASRLAMRRALAKLSPHRKSVVLVDGPAKIKGIALDQIAVIKGDRKVFAIACASVIAKVTRDGMMARYAKRYPKYGFEKHKGYSTELHRTQLSQHGVCPIHRRSFAPVAKLL